MPATQVACALPMWPLACPGLATILARLGPGSAPAPLWAPWPRSWRRGSRKSTAKRTIRNGRGFWSWASRRSVLVRWPPETWGRDLVAQRGWGACPSLKSYRKQGPPRSQPRPSHVPVASGRDSAACWSWRAFSRFGMFCFVFIFGGSWKEGLVVVIKLYSGRSPFSNCAAIHLLSPGGIQVRKRLRLEYNSSYIKFLEKEGSSVF